MSEVRMAHAGRPSQDLAQRSAPRSIAPSKNRSGGRLPDDAAARLFQERFPRKALPNTPDAVRAALIESESAPGGGGSGLAQKRVELVRDMVKKAGIDPVRLLEAKRVETEEAGPGQVKLDLVEPENPRRPGGKGPEFLRRLMGSAETAAPAAR
jgi:hypothetical protein